MTELVIKGLCAQSKNKTLVKNANLRLKSGELLVVLGPNGAGKTSLLRAILGMIPQSSDSRQIAGQAIASMTSRQLARHVAYLPQTRPLAWPKQVMDVVALGRFAHGLPLTQLRGADLKAVQHAMQRCEIDDLAERNTDELSGGELARVHFARALAAETPILFADEPITALDPRHQLRIMDLIQQYARDGGAALVVLHDLELAARYADRLIWMQNGHITADGSVESTLTPERLADVYGVEVEVDGSKILLKRPL